MCSRCPEMFVHGRALSARRPQPTFFNSELLQVVLQQCAVADLAGLAPTAVMRSCAAATLSWSTVTAMPPTTLPACAALPSLPLLPFFKAKSWYRLWCGWSTASRSNKLCKVACITHKHTHTHTPARLVPSEGVAGVQVCQSGQKVTRAATQNRPVVSNSQQTTAHLTAQVVFCQEACFPGKSQIQAFCLVCLQMHSR